MMQQRIYKDKVYGNGTLGISIKRLKEIIVYISSANIGNWHSYSTVTVTIVLG